jgi:mono/diheme cytochrome c family protein
MKKSVLTLLITAFLFASNCGQKSPKSTNSESAQSQEQGLSAFEQENGIGPITEVVTLPEATQARIDEGQEIFKTKCSACHKTTERYIGPDLGLTLNKRTPAYVMNMILNPDGMVKEHPEAKALLAEFLSPMPNQNLTEDQALAIVEYLNSVTREEEN